MGSMETPSKVQQIGRKKTQTVNEMQLESIQ